MRLFLFFFRQIFFRQKKKSLKMSDNGYKLPPTPTSVFELPLDVQRRVAMYAINNNDPVPVPVGGMQVRIQPTLNSEHLEIFKPVLTKKEVKKVENTHQSNANLITMAQVLSSTLNRRYREVNGLP
jgi:hypothetical protein